MRELGVKIKLKEHFSIIRESLERIGIPDKKNKIITPICYILHKNNYKDNSSEYFIICIKNLRILDGEDVFCSEEDLKKEICVAKLLEKWGLIEIEEPSEKIETLFIYILPFNEKKNWMINHLYKIGNKKRNE